MEDFDGDNKSDLAVFRPGAPGNSFWYILNSSNATVDIINFGQSGDDESVVGDYDGDGKADLAVYRGGSPLNGEGGTPGQSNWWYRKSSVGARVALRQTVSIFSGARAATSRHPVTTTATARTISSSNGTTGAAWRGSGSLRRMGR